MLKEREIQILRTIANLRFVNSFQLHQLHGYKGKYGERVTRRKLSELESESMLKSFQPSAYERKIYYISRKGAKEVESFLGCDPIKTYKKNTKTLHQVMVSDIFVQLKKSGLGEIQQFQIESKIHDDLMSDVFVKFKLKTNGKKKLLFIESDRGTESAAIIEEKLKKYDFIYRSHKYQNQYGIFPDILFVTINDTRKRALLNLSNRFKNLKVVVGTLDEFITQTHSFLRVPMPQTTRKNGGISLKIK